jgi:hypothetical protein
MQERRSLRPFASELAVTDRCTPHIQQHRRDGFRFNGQISKESKMNELHISEFGLIRQWFPGKKRQLG